MDRTEPDRTSMRALRQALRTVGDHVQPRSFRRLVAVLARPGSVRR